MLLTLYFIAATWMQSWRLQRVYAHLSRFVAQRTSIAFVAAAPVSAAEPQTSAVDGVGTITDDAANVADSRRKSSSVIGDTEDTTDSKRCVATSDLCTNASAARIADVIWSADDRQGVALTPKQQLTLEPWIEFPAAPSLVPFDVGPGTFRWAKEHDESAAKLYVLLETLAEPVRVKENSVLRIEDFGRLIAWKLDSRFAVLLETDLRGFAALVTRSFMQNNLVVNDYLPLVRVESVDITGEPQPFDSIRQHSRPELCARRSAVLSHAQWQRHVQSMRDLNILASQASDFKYHRMRTEGKTGLSKPDLIPLASIVAADAIVSPISLTPPRRLSNDAPEKQQMRRPSPRVSPRTSPLRLIPETVEDGATGIVTATLASTVAKDTVDSVPSPAKPSPVTVELESPVKAAQPEQSQPPKSFAQFPTPSPEKPTAIAAAIVAEQPAQPPIAVSVRSNGAPRPTLVRSKGSLLAAKPPNVLVYSESTATRDAVISTLATLLAEDVYTVYPLSAAEVRTTVWLDNTTMLVVCGSVAPDIGAVLTEFFLRGGKMLSLCSDVLHIVLPTFRTHAEVREHELVQFSYGRWQRVRMMHHIFCYQPSPVRKHFSTDSEESPAASSSGGPVSAASSRKPSSLVCPRSVEVDDMQQKTHTLQVQVLGTEETWNTPSLILATNASSGGKAVFSQVHLEADPHNYEHDDAKFPVLRQSNAARMEIFSDLLGAQLGIAVRSPEERSQAMAGPKYTSGYFLGDYMVKFELLERLKADMAEPKTLKLPQLTMRFCGHREEPPPASATLLPIMINSCPENFSTVDYFENLKATKIGRLAIYVPVITTTTNVLNGVQWSHGLTVIARHQTAASGRSKNQWLSPDGCLMFSVQLHVPLSSPLGQRLSLLQHLVAVALVNAVLTIDGYEVLNIGLKWPNDMYANGRTKIGGLIVGSQIQGQTAVCNVGCGLNLDNSTPTVCINDLIRDHNATAAGRQKPLAALGHERLLALCCTELERLFEAVQAGDLQQLYTLYDRLWLHSDAEVSIVDAHGTRKSSKIIGIDEYGFLLVQRPGEPAESVHPDGNSFDMLRGLIVPKTQ